MAFKPVKNLLDPIDRFAEQDLAYYFTKDQYQWRFLLGPCVVIYL